MNENKSSSEILDGVVLNSATIKLIEDFTDALRLGNKINKEQLELAKKQDEYQTGKDGFVKDVAEIIESRNNNLLLKLTSFVTIATLFVSGLFYLLNDAKIKAITSTMKVVAKTLNIELGE